MKYRMIGELQREDARRIVEAHEIDTLMQNEEESELLAQNNPGLFAAYVHLLKIARDE